MDFRHFDKRKISAEMLTRNVGQKDGRPFVITAAIVETSFGDLLCVLCYLATLKAQFDNAKLFVRYRDVTPYNREIMSLFPAIDRAVGVRWHVPAWARLWAPDSRLWNVWARAIDSKTALHRSFCDFLATDWMLNARSLHAIPNPVPLKVPEDRIPALRQNLIDLGIDPERWFMVMHYRTSTYLNKTSGELRNGIPESYRALVDYAIDELDGQVVQLGHPEMEPFAPRPGFVDLSRLKDSFILQAFAVSHARYMVGGPSGPVALGWGFQVPTGSVDASDARGSWGMREHVSFTHEVTTPTGEILQNRALYEAGLLDYQRLRDKIRAGENYTVRKNSFEELAAVTDHLHSITGHVTGWRTPAVEYDGTRPNHFVWPPQTDENQNFFEIGKGPELSIEQ